MAFSLIPTAVSSSRMGLWLVFLRREESVLRHLHLEANSTRHCRLAGTQPRAWQCQPGAELMNHSSISVTQPRARCPGLASTNMPRCRAPTVFSEPGYVLERPAEQACPCSPHHSSPESRCANWPEQKRWVPRCCHTWGWVNCRAPELCLWLVGPQQPAFVICVTVPLLQLH